MYAKYIKRILDFILSLIALIVLSPVLLVVAILVRIKPRKPNNIQTTTSWKRRKNIYTIQI